MESKLGSSAFERNAVESRADLRVTAGSWKEAAVRMRSKMRAEVNLMLKIEEE
jgi:hypothetical protein